MLQHDANQDNSAYFAHIAGLTPGTPPFDMAFDDALEAEGADTDDILEVYQRRAAGLLIVTFDAQSGWRITQGQATYTLADYLTEMRRDG